MKFIQILPLAALMVLAACNSKSENNAAENAAESADTVVAEQTVVEAADTVAAVDVVVNVTPGTDPAAAPGKPAVIDFSAVWCGPCQQFKPTFHKVAGEYASKATFYAADLDECKELGEKYKIESIPTVVILKEGAEPVMHVGLLSEAEFKELLDKNL